MGLRGSATRASTLKAYFSRPFSIFVCIELYVSPLSDHVRQTSSSTFLCIYITISNRTGGHLKIHKCFLFHWNDIRKHDWDCLGQIQTYLSKSHSAFFQEVKCAHSHQVYIK